MLELNEKAEYPCRAYVLVLIYAGGGASMASSVRGESLERLVRLIMLINSGKPISASEAQRQLKCSRASVYRYFKTFEAAEELPFFKDRAGRWRVTPGSQFALRLGLTAEEILSLVLARQAMGQLAGSDIDDALTNVIRKLESVLLPKQKEKQHSLNRLTSVGQPESRKRDQPHLEVMQIIGAINEHRRIRLTYRKLSQSKPESYEFDPWHLHVQPGAMYLFGYSHKSRAARMLSVERITVFEPTGAAFQPNDSFDPSEWLHGAFGPWEGELETVKLRFSGVAAGVVAEKKMHPSQVLQVQPDSSLLMTLRVPLSPAVLRWVRGFSGEVEILEPEKLRTAV